MTFNEPKSVTFNEPKPAAAATTSSVPSSSTKAPGKQIRYRTRRTAPLASATHISFSNSVSSAGSSEIKQSPSSPVQQPIANTPLKHSKRFSNDCKDAVEQREKLKLPPANSKQWKDLDLLISTALASEFSHTISNTVSPTTMADKLTNIIYSSMRNLFGCQEKLERPSATQTKPNPKLAELRTAKKQLKRERQRVIRQYGKGSPAEKAISSSWFKVMHEHARLRTELEKRDKNRFNSKQQQRFKKDPIKFGRSLFEKKNSGEPAFSGDQAYSFFSKTYRDDSRDKPFDPLPDMKPPHTPEFFFSEHCPTSREILGIIKRKSNGSSPGLDAISYVPYKRCPSILPVLVKLFEKVWISKQVPSEWAAASIILLAKSSKLSAPQPWKSPISKKKKPVLQCFV